MEMVSLVSRKTDNTENQGKELLRTGINYGSGMGNDIMQRLVRLEDRKGLAKVD